MATKNSKKYEELPLNDMIQDFEHQEKHLSKEMQLIYEKKDLEKVKKTEHQMAGRQPSSVHQPALNEPLNVTTLQVLVIAFLIWTMIWFLKRLKTSSGEN